ncbi:MAG: AbrB/MazE/SpoVT family DNA-binding domain-containing protein [Candidatus Bipolaricaulia bacterium]
MPLVKIKDRYQVTIPAKFREALGVQIGDYLEAELQDDKIVFTPKLLMDKETAWNMVRTVLDRVHAKIGDVDEAQVEQEVSAAIEAVRKEDAAQETDADAERRAR